MFPIVIHNYYRVSTIGNNVQKKNTQLFKDNGYIMLWL